MKRPRQLCPSDHVFNSINIRLRAEAVPPVVAMRLLWRTLAILQDMNGVSGAGKHTLHRRRFLVNRNPDNCIGLVHEQLDIAKAFAGSSENPTGDVDQGGLPSLNPLEIRNPFPCELIRSRLRVRLSIEIESVLSLSDI